MFGKMNLTPLGIDVLALLARSPGKEYYVRELAKLVNGSVGGCHEAAKRLRGMGLVKSRKSGRNLYYTVNEENPAVFHFKIFVNTLELNTLVEDIRDMSMKIVLFGSCSIGKDTVESDIDLLVVTEEAEDVKKALVIKYLNGRRLRPVILAPHELIELKGRDKAFYNEMNKGMVIWREKHE
ncbi:MAG: nucleotidyltransferase domain-containing protein [Thermoplasmata archaeon]|nr:nucleotidyltransferase domain-containing protein [Thermoplasmata archaeon]